MIRRTFLLAVSLCLAGFAGCDTNDRIVIPAAPPDTVRVSFQDGSLPDASYHGTSDAILKDGPRIDWRNGNFGAVSSDTIGFAALSSGIFERRLIIMMDLSSIQNCSQVLSASLSIRIVPPVTDAMEIEVHRVMLADYVEWMEGFGGPAAGVSWTTIDGGVPWIAEGGDFDGAILDQKTVSNDTLVIFSLSPIVVRGWILKPDSNHGVIIKAADTSPQTHAIVFLSEYDAAAWRPRLDITYLRGG